MRGRMSSIGLALLCLLTVGAVASQAASAKGTTAFTCKPGTGEQGFEDAHCDRATSEKAQVKFVHEAITGTTANVLVTNAGTKEETKKATTAVMRVPNLHGFKNLVIECTNVEGVGTMENKLVSGVMQVVGQGTMKFNNGSGVNCSTNQTGCTAKVAETPIRGTTVETTETEMGYKVEPGSGGSIFTTVAFEGTCGLHAFGAIPISGTSVGTQGTEPNGHGGTLVLTEAMSSLSVGGSPATITGILTFAMKEGNTLTLTTTSP
jgi:hypothetical protein